MMNIKKIRILLIIFLLLVSAPLSNAHASGDKVARGVYSILTGVVELPYQIVQQTVSQPPIIGTVSGVVIGSIRTVSKVVGGAFDIVTAAAPYAKYALFAL